MGDFGNQWAEMNIMLDALNQTCKESEQMSAISSGLPKDLTRLSSDDKSPGSKSKQ